MLLIGGTISVNKLIFKYELTPALVYKVFKVTCFHFISLAYIYEEVSYLPSPAHSYLQLN